MKRRDPLDARLRQVVAHATAQAAAESARYAAGLQKASQAVRDFHAAFDRRKLTPCR